MGQVAFNRTPTNLRVPLFYAEVNSGLSFFSGNSKHLLIGQKLQDGSAVAGQPILVNRNVGSLFGKGSMLEDMCRVARRNNPFGEIWCLPIAEPTGVQATRGLTVSTITNLAGTIVVYVCGRRVEVAVLPTDDENTVAANIADAINAGYIDLDGYGYLFPITAAVGSDPNQNIITLTARHKGIVSNLLAVDLDIVGDEGPLQQYLTLSGSGFTSGTGTPTTLASALANCGASEFDMISMPYSDTTSLNILRDFLADDGGRWDPTQQVYGHFFTAAFGNLAAMSTLGVARNDPHGSIMGVVNSPSPPWVWAAAIGAKVQLHKNLGADLADAGEISRPMQTLVLQDVLPPKRTVDQWRPSDRQSLYFDGISAFHVTPDGQVAIDRLITTYQTNAWAQPDTTFLDIETMYQTVYGIRFLRLQITQKHPRDALVPTNPGGLQGFTTPDDLKGDCIHAYKQLETAGVMKNSQLFADSLVVEQAADPDRVNAYLPFDVVNQLRIFAANATIFLNAANV